MDSYSSNKKEAWLEAIRLRTLPLALSCIGMGSFLAAYDGHFSLPILILAAITTISLQILSNLANDYGDTIHGADSAEREGPKRAVQSGAITSAEMKRAIVILAIISLISGIALIWLALGDQWYLALLFLGFGLASIWAAITYTAGKNPYGYMGLGDISVFIFFGLLGVGGTYFLHAGSITWDFILPAVSCGLFATGVLNLNNIRDITSDIKAGKRSIPVRLGRSKAIIYHWTLLALGFGAACWFVALNQASLFSWLFVFSAPLFLINARAVAIHQTASTLDPFLKQLAISTLLFVLLFGIGILL